MGKVVLLRKNNYLGALVKHNIYIDGYMIGKIGNGQVVNIDVDEGKHEIQLKSILSGRSNVIDFYSSKSSIIKMIANVRFSFKNEIDLKIVSKEVIKQTKK